MFGKIASLGATLALILIAAGSAPVQAKGEK